MPPVKYITPDFAVSGALAPEDLAALAEAGFRTIISNRPDNEERGQPDADALASEAARLGLAFRHIPTTKLEVFTDPVVSAMTEALSGAPGPILAFCKSGLRSATVWAAASARGLSVDEVLAALKAAGFELSWLRDDLDSQADRGRWMGEPQPAERTTASSAA